MNPLSGREASVLALLAQYPTMSLLDRERVMAGLDGEALEIARTIVGENPHPKNPIKRSADGFKEWAQSLRGHNDPRR